MLGPNTHVCPTDAPRFAGTPRIRSDQACPCPGGKVRFDLLLGNIAGGGTVAVARVLGTTPCTPTETAVAVRDQLRRLFPAHPGTLLVFESGGAGLREPTLRSLAYDDRDRAIGFHLLTDQDLLRAGIPATATWPAEWWPPAKPATPAVPTDEQLKIFVAATSTLPPISGYYDLSTKVPLVGPTESAPAAPARESAFGDASIGELLGLVEAKRAARERAGRPCVERIPLAQVAPGPEASLADLVAGLVRDDAGGSPGKFVAPRVLALPWRGFVVLQPCRLAPYWAICGKLQQDLHPDRLQLAHPLAIDGAPLRLRTELSVRGYVPCDGWIEEAAHRGLEIWSRPNASAGYPNPRDAYSAELAAVRDGAGYSGDGVAIGYGSHPYLQYRKTQTRWEEFDPHRSQGGRP